MLSTTTPDLPAFPALQQDMSFFITSVGSGNGANLGGIEGADRHCATLAEAAGVRGKTWHAYLSQQAVGGKPAINARDRIGKGPWKNVKGVVVATSVDDLHSDNNKLSKENSLTEKGTMVNGRGDTPNTHDILTGSTLDGRVSTDAGDSTCSNWTSSAESGSALLGHHDRQGGGANPTSWNSSHASRGCGQENLRATGGAGLFYCFAV
ncbi:hypothetical protein [Gemmatimonas aurantiaca]|uniref:hypothetical protein n=1 Tax=Gemmatimonas aurantiaca TaxID=173480 RepID=UPI0031F3FD26